MPAFRLPLVGSYIARKSNPAAGDSRDQRFVNCFPEIIQNPITKKATIYLQKRHGCTGTSDVSGGAIGRYGSVIWASNISTGAIKAPVVQSFLKSTSTMTMFVDVNGGNGQVGGDVANTNECLFMSETSISAVGNLTASLVDSSTGAIEAWFFPTGGAWTQITDGDFPTNIAAAHCHMDGYMFVMTEGGRIYNSDLNSLSSWNPTNFITASSSGDGGAGCLHYRNFILGFGDYSLEFFVNSGNATGSILSRLADATIPIGALRTGNSRPPSIRIVGDAVYWIGVNADSGTRGIYKLVGMKHEKISTPAIDGLIAASRIKFIIGSFTMFGMTHVVFDTTAANSPMCYCVETGFWWMLIISPLQPVSMNGAPGSSYLSKSFLACANSAKVYTFDQSIDAWQDATSTYLVTAQTQSSDLGTSRLKIYDALTVIADVEASTSQLSIATSDDDGVTFTNQRTINLSSLNTRTTRWGASRKRAWQFTHQSPAPFRIEAIEIEYKLGGP